MTTEPKPDPITSPDDVIGANISISGTNKCIASFADDSGLDEYNHGDEIVVLIRARVTEVAFPLFDNKYPTAGRVRHHKAKVIAAADLTDVEAIPGRLADYLAEHEERRRIAREEAEGVFRLPTDGGRIGTSHDDGLDTSGVVIQTNDVVVLDGLRVNSKTGEVLP